MENMGSLGWKFNENNNNYQNLLTNWEKFIIIIIS